MSQRDSGFARIERDSYMTPSWVTHVLIPHIPEKIRKVWEPAAGSGKMAKVLIEAGYDTWSTDIEDGDDFLDNKTLRHPWNDAIITNPPYTHAKEFIECALQRAGFVAMLLRADYDHAKTRQHLFLDTRFAKKIILTKRIRWFEGTKGGPSFNHSWFCWSVDHKGPPTLAYGP